MEEKIIDGALLEDVFNFVFEEVNADDIEISEDMFSDIAEARFSGVGEDE